MTSLLPELAAARGLEHATLVRHVVISRVVHRLLGDGVDGGGASGVLPPWLVAYHRALAEREPVGLPAGLAPAWWQEELTAHEARAVTLSPLQRVPRTQALVLVAAGLIEQDIRFGALFAQLQEPLGSRRPCIGLLSWLLEGPDLPPAMVAAAARTLVARGMVQVDNPGDPRSEWVVRVPAAVQDLLDTAALDPTSLPEGLTHRAAADAVPLDRLELSEGTVDLVSRLPELLADGDTTLVVRGMQGSGRTSLHGSLAREVGQDLLVLDGTVDGAVDGDAARVLGALASLADLYPVLRLDVTAGESLRLSRPVGVTGPVGVVLGRSGGITGPLADRSVTVTLGSVAAEARRRLWMARPTVPSLEGGALDQVVERFLLTPGAIARTRPLAAAAALAAARSQVSAEDVQTASRTLNRQVLETLARPVGGLDLSRPPVMTPAAAAELSTLVARCRHRERLSLAAGRHLSGGMNRGVRALFTGPSGTGKTLAARYLAALLHLDLYRVDLSAVVTKYIGETERNLDRILSRAEELDVVLLLDEGDALMTRRTDVGNANDRYANLETNFLLQRLESFEGIAVVTTNVGGRIDQAFLRRIDVTVDFVAPDAERRWRIWTSHLPPGHDVPDALVADVSRRCQLTGGQIRNAVLHAMVLALERRGQLGGDDLVVAVHREYQRAGASCPLPLDAAAVPAGARRGRG